MNTRKFIILIMLTFPILAAAQRIGTSKYRVSTGDTTKIVNHINSGLNNPESKFLFSKSGKIIDSLYSEINPNITVAEAAREVNDLLKEIERDQAIVNAGNKSLSYRLSMQNVAELTKEKKAKAYADSVLMAQRMMSERQLADQYIKYGNKPTYYINGVEVVPETLNQIMSGDIVGRDIKTNSVNPNGEVWLTLTDRGAQRLKLILDDPDRADVPSSGRYESKEGQEEKNIKIERVNEKNSNSDFRRRSVRTSSKREPVDRANRNEEARKSAANRQEKVERSEIQQKQDSTQTPRTRVRARTIQKVGEGN